MITALDPITALVLIDLQKGIAQGNLAHPLEDVLKNAAALVDHFHARQLPVVIVNVDPSGATWIKARTDAKPTLPDPLPPGFTEIVPQLDVRPGDIRITKRTWSAFFDTGLHEELQAHKVIGIVLGGVATSIGVEGTARAASERGYHLTFALDAMTDRTIEGHEHSVTRIFPRIGECGSTAEVVEKLS